MENNEKEIKAYERRARKRALAQFNKEWEKFEPEFEQFQKERKLNIKGITAADLIKGALIVCRSYQHKMEQWEPGNNIDALWEFGRVLCVYLDQENK